MVDADELQGLLAEAGADACRGAGRGARRKWPAGATDDEGGAPARAGRKTAHPAKLARAADEEEGA